MSDFGSSDPTLFKFIANHRPAGYTPPMQTLRSAADLVRAGLVADPAPIEAVARLYAIAVPPAFQALITHPDDPIGRQVIPHPNELLTAANEHEDPTADAAMSPVEGVVRRYPDRALLKPVLACPLYCRFCFRRAHVGPEGSLLSETALDAALNWIAGEAALREVILTGGDPLILSPRRLAHIMGRLSAMPHIDTIRIHTRVPVAAPERIDDALIASLTTDTPLRVILHANAAAELTEAARAAIRHLLTAAIPVLSQSVLLRGVNDTPERLESLLRALLKARVTPATLHQLDRAPGTARFHVPIEEGRALLASLRGRVPGDAIPTYVLDIEGGHGKVPIGPDYLAPDAQTVRDPWGNRHSLAARHALG
jgi:lysine 2,3-aminomutase